MVKNKMNNIVVRRYADNEAGDWQGWIEDEAQTWIAFIHEDGSAMFFLNREPSGAIICN